jgi:hypothetical protein
MHKDKSNVHTNADCFIIVSLLITKAATGAERASDEADHNEFNRRSSTGNGSSLDTAGALDYG